MASSYAAVAAAIFTKTNLSPVTGAGHLSGIFEGKAPQGQAYPYGVFNQQAGSPVTYTFGPTQALDSGFIQFRVYAETPERAQSDLAQWLATLGNTLTVTGFTTGWLARESDLPSNDQLKTDGYIYGRGALLRYGME